MSKIPHMLGGVISIATCIACIVPASARTVTYWGPHGGAAVVHTPGPYRPVVGPCCYGAPWRAAGAVAAGVAVGTAIGAAVHPYPSPYPYSYPYPVYVAPRPVVYAPPVVVAPAPVYVYPAHPVP